MNRVQQFLFSFLFLIAFLSFTKSNAQYYYYDNRFFDSDVVFEVGGGIGGMNCITDIGGSKSKKSLYINEIGIKNTKPNVNFYLSAMYQQTVGVTLQGTYGNIKAYDSILKDEAGPSRLRYFNRNANFRSSIREIAALVEFHPLMLKYYENGPPKFSPYVLAGLGWFSFNPQTNINGKWIDTKPLSTEGQGFPEFKDRNRYHLSQSNIPVGIGIKYELSSLFNLRAEFIHRFTHTDYLDDVSKTFIDPALFDTYLSSLKASQAKAIYNRAPTPQAAGTARGDSKSNDSYMTFNVKIGFLFGRERR